MMVYFKLGRKYERDIILSVTQATRKKQFRVPPTGVEPMTFRTPVGRSTTELQENKGQYYGHFAAFWVNTVLKLLVFSDFSKTQGRT